MTRLKRNNPTEDEAHRRNGVLPDPARAVTWVTRDPGYGHLNSTPPTPPTPIDDVVHTTGRPGNVPTIERLWL